MGEILWMKFVDACVQNLHEVLLRVGVNGLLSEYDRWLEAEGYIKCKHGTYCRHSPTAPTEARGNGYSACGGCSPESTSDYSACDGCPHNPHPPRAYHITDNKEEA